MKTKDMAVPCRRDAGNIMFFILVAIVLLAALSFAITQGGRDAGNDVSTERQRLLATEIIDYGDVIQKSVQLLRSRGIAFNNLSFAAPGLPNAYGTPGTAPAAEIFNDAGAAALYKTADEQSFANGVQPFIFTAGNEIAEIGTTCAAADCTDLLMLLPGLTRDLCVEINRQLAVGAAGGEPPGIAEFDTTPFAGTPDYRQTVGAGSGSSIAGKTAACVRDAHDASYTFYQVLEAR